MRSPCCLANVPRRLDAHPGRTHSPTSDPFAPLHPEKTVTFPRRPCTDLDTHLTRIRPPQAPRLRRFFPPIRPSHAISPTLLKVPHIRATLDQARDRPRRPGILYPQSGLCPRHPQGPHVLATAHRPRCPVLPGGATHVPGYAPPGITDSRRTGDTLSYEVHRMSQNLTENRFPAFAGPTVGGSRVI